MFDSSLDCNGSSGIDTHSMHMRWKAYNISYHDKMRVHYPISVGPEKEPGAGERVSYHGFESIQSALAWSIRIYSRE